MSERNLEKEMKLSAKEWKELHEGIRFSREFLRQYPNGVKDVMELAKEGAKNQIKTNILSLLTPLTNEIDNLFAEITKSLGLQEGIFIISNAVIDVLSSFTSFVKRLLLVVFNEELHNKNLENMSLWMDLFNPFIMAITNIFLPDYGIPDRPIPEPPVTSIPGGTIT